MKHLIVAACMFAVAGCVANKQEGAAILENVYGLENVQMQTKYNPMYDCRGFTATSGKTGKPVKGDICYSWSQGQVVSFLE